MTEKLREMKVELEVLVVEDEPRLRDLLLSAIPDMGFRAAGTSTAEEALRVMDEHERDILILDLNLPGMSGIECLEEIRQRWPQTSVIILTGFGDLESAKKAIRLEAVDFLTKPASLGDLEMALDRARRRRVSQVKAEMFEAPPRRPAPRPKKDGETAQTLDDIERETILSALHRNKGNRAVTAAEVGISIRTLYYRLAEYQRQGFMP